MINTGIILPSLGMNTEGVLGSSRMGILSRADITSVLVAMLTAEDSLLSENCMVQVSFIIVLTLMVMAPSVIRNKNIQISPMNYECHRKLLNTVQCILCQAICSFFASTKLHAWMSNCSQNCWIYWNAAVLCF